MWAVILCRIDSPGIVAFEFADCHPSANYIDITGECDINNVNQGLNKSVARAATIRPKT